MYVIGADDKAEYIYYPGYNEDKGSISVNFLDQWWALEKNIMFVTFNKYSKFKMMIKLQKRFANVIITVCAIYFICYLLLFLILVFSPANDIEQIISYYGGLE